MGEDQRGRAAHCERAARCTEERRDRARGVLGTSPYDAYAVARGAFVYSIHVLRRRLRGGERVWQRDSKCS